MTCGFWPIRGAADALKASRPKPGYHSVLLVSRPQLLIDAHRVSARASVCTHGTPAFLCGSLGGPRSVECARRLYLQIAGAGRGDQEATRVIPC